MRVIIVDDERLALRQFEMETEDMPGVEVAGAFTNPVDALAYVQEHPVEAAFLDIAMPGMNGLALAEKLREIRPDLVVIFLTGYEQYTLDALKVKADYYLTKPYNKQDITEALERARLLAARQKKRVYARTFGRFDVFIDGEAVYFPNAKAKELLALCVDHRGGAVTIEEVLAEHGAEALFSGSRGACQIDVRQMDCDYYEFLQGNRDALRAWQISGSYLEEYSWAEETGARLENFAEEMQG